jgi:hypothetical protein
MREYSMTIHDFDGANISLSADSDSPLDLTLVVDPCTAEDDISTVYLTANDTLQLRNFINLLYGEHINNLMVGAEESDEEETEEETEE